MSLALLIIGIALAAIFGAVLAIPVALLEIAAGVIASNFFVFHANETIELLGGLGIIALMYLAGLEIDVPYLKKNFKELAVIGGLSFFSPFLLVIAVSYLFLGFSFDVAILSGIALSTTSVAIVYPIVRNSRLGKKSIRLIISAAMVADALSMITLGVFFSKFSFFTIIVIAILVLLYPIISKWGEFLFSRIKGTNMRARTKVILMMLLFLWVLAEKGGVEIALIAFIIGIFSAELIAEHSVVNYQLRTLTFGFLAPIFFFSAGIRVNLAELLNYFNVFAILLFVAFSAKYLMTYFGWKQYHVKQAHFVSLLFNCRLSIGIIAANLGLSNGIIGTDIYSVLIGTVILSSIMALMLSRKEIKRLSL